MTDHDLSQIAKTLLSAYEQRSAVPPLTQTYPGLTIADAYDIQVRQVQQWVSEGRVIRGHKVGLTSAVMQRQLGVDQPDYGHLLADMFYLESLPVDTGRFIAPRVEPEVAFVLNDTLAGPGVTAADAIAAVDYVLPALEIIDSRIADWKIGLIDTVADNASSGAVVLGSRPVSVVGLDLRLTGCNLYQGGQAVGAGAGGAALGSPLNALVWLANTLGALGTALEAGSVVLPGSLTAAVPVAAGRSVTAVFAGIGSVTAHFTSTENS
jgi:2-keto-4-pentenoate hydratase